MGKPLLTDKLNEQGVSFSPNMVDAEGRRLFGQTTEDLAMNVLWESRMERPQRALFSGYCADPSGTHSDQSRRIEAQTKCGQSNQ